MKWLTRWRNPSIKSQELEPREAYRLWAENYPPRAHNVLMQVEQQAMLARLPEVRDRRALDLAGGTGRYALLLKERGARVSCFDVSYEMLSRADENLRRTQSDLRHVPLKSGCADLIVCGLAIGHVLNLMQVLIEMTRLLKPGGVALYSDFHPRGRDLGWQRTFRAATGRLYAVQFVTHTIEAHRQAAQIAGLSIEIVEAGVSKELAATNADAAWYRSKWGDTPVAVVIRASKS
jgi:malonyl-CoA O-methyltransferase